MHQCWDADSKVIKCVFDFCTTTTPALFFKVHLHFFGGQVELTPLTHFLRKIPRTIFSFFISGFIYLYLNNSLFHLMRSYYAANFVTTKDNDREYGKMAKMWPFWNKWKNCGFYICFQRLILNPSWMYVSITLSNTNFKVQFCALLVLKTQV